jgi:hypothetical protein
MGWYAAVPAQMLWSDRGTIAGGLELNWILLALLVMIWAVFLLPHRSRSPASSVEAFERKMNLLADANRSTGRWVLVPQRGERFLGPRERYRARARRRRRHVFVALIDATLLTLLMGLFPPFRIMLIATGILVILLLGFTSVLVQIRFAEDAAARARAPSNRRTVSVAAMSRAAVADARRFGGLNGNGNGHAATDGNGYSHPASIGRHPSSLAGSGQEADDLHRLIDDDVHVIVRRSEDLEAESLASAAT